MSSLNKKDTIVIYCGRFQPFHKGHHDVYRYLKERFTNVFISTTNTKSKLSAKERKRYPFTFEQKLSIMNNLGKVDTYDIVPTPVSNPYSDAQVLSYIRDLKSSIELGEDLPDYVVKNISNIDLNNLLILFVISEKDMNPDDGSRPRFVFPDNNLVYTKKVNNKGRKIPAKMQQLKYKSKKSLESYTFNNINNTRTSLNFNYVLTAPTSVFTVLDIPIKSATQIRELIINPPHGKTNIDVIESLYDTKITLENITLFSLISEGITLSQGKKFDGSIYTKKLEELKGLTE